MHLVMTGDRSLLAGRISALCEEKLVFKLAEKDDYALAGLRPRDMPDEMPPGRAFRTGSGVEVQVALLAPDASGQGQAAALREIAAPARPPGRGGRGGAAAVPGGRAPVAGHLRARRGRCGPPRDRPAVGAGGRGRRQADRATGPTWPRACPRSSWPGRPSPGGPRSWSPWPVVPCGRDPGGAGRAAALPPARARRPRRRAPGVRRAMTSTRRSSPPRWRALGDRCAVLIDDAEMLENCDAGGELSR